MNGIVLLLAMSVRNFEYCDSSHPSKYTFLIVGVFDILICTIALQEQTISSYKFSFTFTPIKSQFWYSLWLCSASNGKCNSGLPVAVTTFYILFGVQIFVLSNIVDTSHSLVLTNSNSSNITDCLKPFHELYNKRYFKFLTCSSPLLPFFRVGLSVVSQHDCNLACLENCFRAIRRVQYQYTKHSLTITGYIECNSYLNTQNLDAADVVVQVVGKWEDRDYTFANF